MTTLHLVRHGESEWNATRRLQGQTAHVGLTELGRRQAAAAAAALRGTRVDALYSSDLTRALQTAEAIARVLGMDVRTHTGLRERSYGRLEGLPSEDVFAAIEHLDWTDPDARLGGGESLRELRLRTSAAITECLADANGGTLVIVSHGDTIRAALEWLAASTPCCPVPTEIPNGSITSVSPTQ